VVPTCPGIAGILHCCEVSPILPDLVTTRFQPVALRTRCCWSQPRHGKLIDVDGTRSARSRYIGWAMWILVVGLLLVGVWWAVGPWSVNIRGRSYGCGSAFMGRFNGGSLDPMASAAYACHDQAENRRVLAYFFGGLGAALLVLAFVRQTIRSHHARVTSDT
jgi:hypothetical protein